MDSKTLGKKMTQIDFEFIPIYDQDRKNANRQKRIEEHKRAWEYCWDWPGPKIGEPLQVGACIVSNASGIPGYYYCARCIAEQEINPETWLVRIEYPERVGKWMIERYNGIHLILDILEIWAPVDDLSKQTKEQP